MKEGQVRYGLVCNDQGGIRDDVLVYRWPDVFGMVVNAVQPRENPGLAADSRDGMNVGKCTTRRVSSVHDRRAGAESFGPVAGA